MKGAIQNGMSLFQDLKLKRRKVDSRCSSDGESIGTSDSAASLSPEAPTQLSETGSPKEKDRCITPEELMPASGKRGFQPQFFFVVDTKNRLKEPYDPYHNNNNNSLSKNHNNNNISSKVNGVLVKHAEIDDHDEDDHDAIIKVEDLDEKMDSSNGGLSSGPGSPEKNRLVIDESVGSSSITTPSPKNNGHSSDTESIGSQASTSSSSGRSTNASTASRDSSSKRKRERESCDADKPKLVKSEGNKDAVDMHKFSPPLSRPGSSSPPGSGGRVESSSSTLIITKANRENGVHSSSPSPPGPNGHHHHNHQNGYHHNHSNGHGENGAHPSSPSPPSLAHLNHPHHHHNGFPGVLLGGPGGYPHHLHPLNHHHPHAHLIPAQSHLHQRLTAGQDLSSRSGERSVNVPSPLVHVEIRNLAEKSSPHSVVTSTSLSFPHHSTYRINGVRPEVISGGAVTPNSSNAPSPSLSNNNQQQQQNNNNNNTHPNSPGTPVGGNSPSRYQSMINGNGHLHPPSGFVSRKSPNHPASSPASHHSSSRSSNSSSPSNSSSSLHSPGSNTIVAGGSLGLVNSSTGNSPANHHHHVNLNRTPTVIMGEAGGVRTMLWSQPGQNIPTSPTLVEMGHMHSPLGGGNSNGSNGNSMGHPPSNGYGHHNNSNGNSPPHLNGSNSNGSSTNGNSNNNSNGPVHPKGILSMQELWASEALNLSTSPGAGSNGSANGHANGRGGPLNSVSHANGNGHSHNGHTQQSNQDDDDYEQPMICMICEDRATGLHYGIITCEGCKGFFKRTVQNRRVYTCVADGTCEITKAQRNRCQYCRFKKCIEQGMVLQAVREDRMPGGRNSGAVYNLYKVPVKYRKHKKGNRGAGAKGDKNGAVNGQQQQNGVQQQGQQQQQQQQQHHQPSPHPPSIIQSGNILLTALTSPNEVTHLRQQSLPYEHSAAMINKLVQCDNFHDIAAFKNWEELLEGRGDLSEKLLQMGDSIVYRLVQWTKRLPFYQEVPQDVITLVLTQKWHELLVLTTSAWHAMHTPGPPLNVTAEEEAMESLQVLQRCLGALMGRNVTVEQLRQDVGEMVDRLTFLTRTFRRMNIRIEEYVCLKVITMLQGTGSKSPEVAVIQERYIKYLRTFLEVNSPNQPNRLNDLLRTLSEVQASARLLLESKMFYVPFLLNSALLQR